MSAIRESPHPAKDRVEVIGGCLLGMAVGDALGLPMEGLSPRRARKLFGGEKLSHKFLLGYGMTSDDTEHACMTAQALLDANGDVDRFQRSLAWRLRWWLIGVPAGIGLGTLRAILKLWIGFPPAKSGVCSAGNGPAMRAPIIGVLLADQASSMRAMVHASTSITHRDIRAEQGATAIAVAAAYAATNAIHQHSFPDVLVHLRRHITEPELLSLMTRLERHLEKRSTAETFAMELGLSRGVTGYIYNTVPIALFCWLRYVGDFRESVTQAVRLGGDTDTVAGITGALAGASTGMSGIPPEWLNGLIEWPRSVRWMEQLASRLGRQFPGQKSAEEVGPLSFPWPAQLFRNMLFALIVIGHGIRRLLPPY